MPSHSMEQIWERPHFKQNRVGGLDLQVVHSGSRTLVGMTGFFLMATRVGEGGEDFRTNPANGADGDGFCARWLGRGGLGEGSLVGSVLSGRVGRSCEALPWVINLDRGSGRRDACG